MDFFLCSRIGGVQTVTFLWSDLCNIQHSNITVNVYPTCTLHSNTLPHVAQSTRNKSHDQPEKRAPLDQTERRKTHFAKTTSTNRLTKQLATNDFAITELKYTWCGEGVTQRAWTWLWVVGKVVHNCIDRSRRSALGIRRLLRINSG